MEQRQGQWKRIVAGSYVYRNGAGHALAYVMRYRGRWVSEIRQGDRFVETKVIARTMQQAMTETEATYRDYRASAA